MFVEFEKLPTGWYLSLPIFGEICFEKFPEHTFPTGWSQENQAFTFGHHYITVSPAKWFNRLSKGAWS